ncbi:DUF1343 domain-containing protein [Flavobacteriaceae bacterium]|jgi:uncharacterized protein YbbC (DUF1343 family)|nr:DUF1343 domain-containing protein [Flavobacteriaceae bacterium]MDC1167518.1 DUF1343 domain-containing protein [Flavobacteriaceae bacterium]MDC3319697.1 DUF1343 domain-containing protein [Flavobacteriaceae bacterium]
MILNTRKSTYLFILFISAVTVSFAQKSNPLSKIYTGADQTQLYLSKLKGKNIAIVANQTSVIYNGNNYTHIVDSLVSLKINIHKVFAPEHGFRGDADAGESVADGIDKKTEIPIISLYGKNKKPTKEQLKDIDLMVFDIQDVGVRFYTYISSLHYVMEACAEQKIPVLLLDRPNPNGHYIDGPVLETEHKSFVGMHPVPVVYGMTIGEYGLMINGEKWLKNGIQTNLTVIPLKNYLHTSNYNLRIKPSPNLPNDTAINLYPSLCFFEGTNVSAGRGTAKQFQIYGSPFLNTKSKFTFTPNPNEGSKSPKHAYIICYGEDLTETKKLASLNLSWLIKAKKQNRTKNFFNSFFTKLAGTEKLQNQIEEKITEELIRASWVEDIKTFRTVRKSYLLYK